MRERREYTESFRQQALKKVYARGSRSIREVAEELSMSLGTLRNWMREDRSKPHVKAGLQPKRPQDLSLADPSLPHPGDRQRQLPLQKLNHQSEKGEENRQYNIKIGHNQAFWVGQFSVQNLGQFWVQINSIGEHLAILGASFDDVIKITTYHVFKSEYFDGDKLAHLETVAKVKDVYIKSGPYPV